METKDKGQENYICRADIKPSENESEWDFEAIAVPVKNGQVRYSYENGEYFLQVLGVERSNINTSRLDLGIPLFDNHPWDQSALKTLGVSMSYEFVPEGLVIRMKWGARADKELKEDVKNKIIRAVSIEGDVQEYTIERPVKGLPIYRATSWTPQSLSLAPVPNDVDAQIAITRNKQKETPQPEGVLKSIINKF